MNYKERYEQALERAKKFAIDGYLDAIAIDDIFSELKESEDERMVRELVAFIKTYSSSCAKQPQKWIAWLEKQGKKLDPDRLVEWLDEHVPTKFEDMQNYVNQFKQDFGL